MDEEEALFNERVKQINRDCLNTFLPYIKSVIGIIVAIGLGFLGLTIYFYQEAGGERKQLYGIVSSNHSNITSVMKVQEVHDRDIQLIKAKVYK